MSTVRRFFVESLPEEGGLVRLGDAEAKHVRVLRLVTGAEVILFDSAGREAAGKLREGSGGYECEMGPAQFSEVRVQTTLLLPLFKGPALEAAIRMVTEIGVDEIRLVETEHSVVKAAKVRDSKMQRLRRIVREAARQSERVRSPLVVEACPWSEAVKQAPERAAKWIFSARAPRGVPALAAPAEELWISVGPEGGFSEAEMDLAASLGLEQVGLGPPVLRAETAAAVATALARDRFLERGSGAR